MRLRAFAYTPPTIDYLQQIVSKAVRENWGANNSYLRSYCETNFEIAAAQGLLYKDPKGRFAIWRIGHLVTNDGTPLFAFFAKNAQEGREPFVLITVRATHNLVYRYRPSPNAPEESILIAEPPKEPRYVIPEYQAGYRIEYDWEHFLRDHRTRLEELLPDVRGDRLLYLAIFGSVEIAHRLHKLNAVPQYHQGRYQYLLPLYITHDQFSRRPDLVAALDEDRDRHVYTVQTLLPPEWAYPNARSISLNIAQFRSWVDDQPSTTARPDPANQPRTTDPHIPAISVETDFPQQTIAPRERAPDDETTYAPLPSLKPVKTRDQWLEEGIALHEAKRYAEALQAFEAAIKLDPQSAAAYYRIGEVYRWLNQPQRALAAYQAALRLDNTLVAAHIAEGNTQWILGNRDEALKAFEAATSRAPGNILASILKGHVLRDMGRFEEALYAYGRAIELDPNYALAWHLKGEVLTKLERITEAQQAYQKAGELGYSKQAS